jgi:hypothetical protein
MAVPTRNLCCCLLPAQAAMAGVTLWGMKLVLSMSMWCNTPASLRASATRAFLGPARQATANAQLFRSEPLTGRVRMTLAACARQHRQTARRWVPPQSPSQMRSGCVGSASNRAASAIETTTSSGLMILAPLAMA